MTGPLVVLAVLAFGGGFLPVSHVLEPVLGHEHAPHTAPWFMALATSLSVGGLGLAWFCYLARPDVPVAVAARLGGLYALVRDKFRVDEAYDAAVVRPVFAAAEFGAQEVDPKVIDGAANGAGAVVATASDVWRRLQTGNVQHYALSFLVGALVLLGYYASR